MSDGGTRWGESGGLGGRRIAFPPCRFSVVVPVEREFVPASFWPPRAPCTAAGRRWGACASTRCALVSSSPLCQSVPRPLRRPWAVARRLGIAGATACSCGRACRQRCASCAAVRSTFPPRRWTPLVEESARRVSVAVCRVPFFMCHPAAFARMLLRRFVGPPPAPTCFRGDAANVYKRYLSPNALRRASCPSSLWTSLLVRHRACSTSPPLWCGDGVRASVPSCVGHGSYLVDPASSHMLVSKIKPCMSKYKLLYTVKLRMAH